MLRSLKSLKGFALHATDGDLGSVEDFYFDDVHWTIRYLVADTSRWLPGRRVLLSPAVLGEPSRATSAIPVSLTKERVKHAPDVESDRPLSRQREIELARHYKWPEYWGVGGPVVPPAPPELQKPSTKASGKPPDPHLRSLSEVVGYRVLSGETRVGRVDDLVADTADWVVRYFVVDTREWRPGGQVLLAPTWVERIDWAEHGLITELTEAELEACPPYRPSESVEREFEEELHARVGRPGYWKR